MNGNPDLDRERLTSLFDDLARELAFARTRVQIYVIGGAAMSMAFDRGRTGTRHEGRELLMKRLGITNVAEATGIHAGCTPESR